MKLESQVCGLTLAKRLKELGVKQESLWYWLAGQVVLDDEVRLQGVKPSHGLVQSAFTVAELGEMLPADMYTFKSHEHGDNGWYGVDRNLEQKPGLNVYMIAGSFEHTEADARAKMLIYLLENKLI